MHNRNLKLILVTCGVALLGVGVWWFVALPTPTTAVLFEVRAIDPTGHPVAGAEVWLQDRGASSDKDQNAGVHVGVTVGVHVGVTDSFGVWRRTVRVDSGEEAKLIFKKKYSALHKRHPAGEYSGEKSFMIRSDDSQRIQSHRGSLQLMPARI